MSDETIITRNGMEVHCYGEWDEYSNCFIAGEWNNGLEMDEFWAGDGWDESEEGKEYPTCWTDVVEHLTAWAKREGHTIYQLESC